MNETSDEDVKILSKTERSPRKKKKRKSRQKITDTSDDDDCTGNDFSQPLFTNEKTNCSPSKPNRRSLKNIFKNSSNFKKLSNDLAHDGSDDENKGQSLTNQQKSPKLSDYEKMLQPRSRLGYMTLKEAMNEKHSRSDQPFLVNNDSCGSSSSLPEISDHVTENNRPRKNRSKSAEMQRGSRQPTEQSIPSPEPYITSTVSKSKHPTTNHSPEQVERGRRMEKTNRVDHSRSREVIDSKHHKDSFSAFMELSNTSPKIGSMTLNRKYSPKHQSENTSFKPCDEDKNELENVKCDKLHTDYVLNIKDKSSTMPNCLGTKPTSLDVVNPTSQMENVSKVNANTNKEKEDISRGGRIEKRLDRRSYKSPRRFCGRSVSRERRKYGLTPNGSEKPDAIVSNNADGISHENHEKPDAIVSNKTAKISPKDREKSYDIVSNKVNLSKDDSKTERQKHSRSPNFFEKSETVLNKADISTAVCSTKSEIETKDTQTEPQEQHVSTHLSRSIQTSMNLLDIKSIDEEATGSAIKKTPKVPEIIEPSNTISEKETSIHEAQNDQIEKESVSSSTSSSEEFKTPQQSPLPVRRSVELLNTDAPLGDRSEAKGGSEKKKPKISFLAVAALKRKLARQRNTKKSKMAEVEKKKGKHDQTVSGETNNDKPKCEKKGENSDKSDKNKTKGDKKGETSEKSDKNKTKCDKKGETSEKSDKKNKTLIYYENETGFNIGDLSFLPETDIIDAEELKKDITIADKKLSFDIVEPIGRDDSIETVYAHRTLAKRRQSEVFREKRKKALSLCKKFVAFLFSHIGLCSLMVAYAILGGFIFKALEGPFEKETKQKVYQCRETTKNSILTYATEMILEKWSRNETAEKIDQLLGVFQTAVYLATEKDGFNNAPGDNLDVEEQWSFASSLLFAITVMTTIGYGHVAPKTDYGRIVTIGYAVFGIPLTLLCLTNIGDLMATGFRMLYAKVCCGLCCILFTPKRRRMPDPEKGQGSGSIEYQEGKETVRTTEVINVPTSVCILLMTSYILLGTLLFSIWEKWDAITGTYFSFITLSTIGFGDVVPGTAMNQWENEEKLVLCAMYLVFGLSLIAMCFNLVQEDVKNKCRWLGAKIGIIDRRQ